MISFLLSHAQLSALSAQLPERADQGIERAEHGKAKNRAQEAKELSIFGRNTLGYSFSKIKCLILNWNIFGAF